MTADQKICANTGSFTASRDIEGNPVHPETVKRFLSPEIYTDKSHVRLITLWVLFPATQVHGALSLHVENPLMTGDDVFETEVMGRPCKDFPVESEDAFLSVNVSSGSMTTSTIGTSTSIRMLPLTDLRRCRMTPH